MSWNVRATPIRNLLCGGNPVMSLSRKKTFPDDGRKAPAINLKRVVFPAPFGPMMPRSSPGLLPQKRHPPRQCRGSLFGVIRSGVLPRWE